MLPFQADDAGLHRGEVFTVTFRDPGRPGQSQTFENMMLWDVSRKGTPFYLKFVYPEIEPDLEQVYVCWEDLVELVPVVSQKKGFWK